jgi:hypothetical protein
MWNPQAALKAARKTMKGTFIHVRWMKVPFIENRLRSW